jgi:hypothetical protein
MTAINFVRMIYSNFLRLPLKDMPNTKDGVSKSITNEIRLLFRAAETDEDSVGKIQKRFRLLRAQIKCSS